MRLIIVLYIFSYFLSPVKIHSQKVNVDSLKLIWNDVSQSDSNRLRVIHKIAWNGYLFTKPDSAFYFAELEFKLAKKMGLKTSMAGALNTQGISFQIRGDYTGAIEYYTRCLNILIEVGKKKTIASSYGNIGSLYTKTGDQRTALDYFKKGYAISLELKDSLGISASLNNMGNVYENLGEYQKSLDYHFKSLEIKKNIGDRKGMAPSFANIGNIYSKQNNFSRAIEYHKKSLVINKELGEQRGEAISLNNIGSVYFRLGDYDNSLDYFNQSLTIKMDMGNKAGITASLANIGAIYDKKKDYSKALTHQTRCLKINTEIGNQMGICQNLSSIGNIYNDKKDFNKSIEYHSQGLALCKKIEHKKGVAASYINLSNSYKAIGEYIRGFEYANKGLIIGEELGSMEEIKVASLSIFKSYVSFDSLNKARVKIQSLIEIHDQELKMNFPILSESEKELYFNKVKGVYDLYYDFSLLCKESTPEITERAYDNALKAKGILLKSSTAMKNTIFSSGDSTLINHYYDWISLKKRIAKLYAKNEDTKSLESEANEYEKELVKRSQEFSDIMKVQKISWKDVRDSLKEGESAIEFIHFTHQDNYYVDSTKKVIYCALVINKNSTHPELIYLFEQSKLENIIGTFPGNNLSYIEQVYGSKENTKTQLYNLIWEPMEELLLGTNKIYISPSGLLHKISFPAIAKEQNIYLCDLYQIETKSSTGKIALPDHSTLNANSTTTVFGGIDYNSDTTTRVIWPYLDGTKIETEEIENLLLKKKRHVKYYTATAATEDIFKQEAPKSNILHVATHGFFYSDPTEIKETIANNEIKGDITFRGIENGIGMRSFVLNEHSLMRSGLVFAAANNVWNSTSYANDKGIYSEDGVLTAQEVSTIDLRKTDLVVLSACETALGDIKGSEGVYGLQRSFKMAGVKYLIMSLWQVPDKETAEFMTIFYTHLTKKNEIKKAFNQAQQLMRKKYDPYFWAAFVLVE